MASTVSAPPCCSSDRSRWTTHHPGAGGQEHQELGGQHEVPGDHVPRAAGDELDDLRVLLDQVLRGRDERAVGQPGHGDGRRPAEHRAALEPPRQTGRRAEPGGSRGGTRSVGEQPGAEVAPVLQGHGEDRQGGGRRQAEQQRPPPVEVEGVRRLAPADRGQPRQGVLADVARRAHEERRADEPAAGRERAAGAAAQLGGDRGGGAEHQPDGAQRGAEQQRPGRRQAGGHPDPPHGEHDAQVRDRRDQQGREQRRPAPDRGGPDQLGAALGLVAAGVPDHREDAHERDQDGHDGEHLEGDRPGHGVDPDGPARSWRRRPRCSWPCGRTAAAPPGRRRRPGSRRTATPTNAAAAATHSGRRTRSRRRANRSRRPVPVAGPPGRREGARAPRPATSAARRGVGDPVAVVPQEQLLQRRRAAGQPPHAERGERGQEAVEPVGLDLAGEPVALARRPAPPSPAPRAGPPGRRAGGPRRRAPRSGSGGGGPRACRARRPGRPG